MSYTTRVCGVALKRLTPAALEIPHPGRNLAWCRSYALPRKFLPQVPLLYNVGRQEIGNKLNLIWIIYSNCSAV
jgi:hypothetical protein